LAHLSESRTVLLCFLLLLLFFVDVFLHVRKFLRKVCSNALHFLRNVRNWWSRAPHFFTDTRSHRICRCLLFSRCKLVRFGCLLQLTEFASKQIIHVCIQLCTH
jgi:hypothetical protein